MHDNVFSRPPVDGSSNFVFITQLNRIDCSDDLVKVPSSYSGIVQFEPDLFGWINDIDTADSEGKSSFSIDVGGILVIKHVVEVGNAAVTVGDDRVLDVSL